jgi:hypothetical protein
MEWRYLLKGHGVQQTIQIPRHHHPSKEGTYHWYQNHTVLQKIVGIVGI